MIFAHDIAINGESLSDVDDRIIVQGVNLDATKVSTSVTTAYGRPGQRITGRRRDTLDVSVSFGIRLKKNRMEERAELFEEVARWAMQAEDGAWITVGHRPERRLRARLESLPAEGDMWQWTNSYTVTFRAYAVPYWQDVKKNSITRTGITTTSQQLGVAGTDKTVLDFEYTNTGSGACDTLTINTGIASFSFASLGCAAGEKLIIDHTEDGLLRIRIHNSTNGYRSAMDKRTAASSDDLWIRPGTPTVAITAAKSGTIVMGTYGRYA